MACIVELGRQRPPGSQSVRRTTPTVANTHWPRGCNQPAAQPTNQTTRQTTSLPHNQPANHLKQIRHPDKQLANHRTTEPTLSPAVSERRCSPTAGPWPSPAVVGSAPRWATRRRNRWFKGTAPPDRTDDQGQPGTFRNIKEQILQALCRNGFCSCFFCECNVAVVVECAVAMLQQLAGRSIPPRPTRSTCTSHLTAPHVIHHKL